QLPKVKKHVDKIAAKSQEATYGCCSVRNIKWQNSEWKFSVQQAEKKFECALTNIDSKAPQITCLE
ncbi:MAG TPA: hypothetical protein VM432_11965, partial [Bdellovibrionales bacterium]|nr:hypothetical protein [Bdellovibrionales bacterium]